QGSAHTHEQIAYAQGVQGLKKGPLGLTQGCGVEVGHGQAPSSAARSVSVEAASTGDTHRPHRDRDVLRDRGPVYAAQGQLPPRHAAPGAAARALPREGLKNVARLKDSTQP